MPEEQNIEAEVRSFISPRQYEELKEFFKNSGKFINEDYQVTYYFSGDLDLRIQKNNFFAKIWLKKGKIHDEQREEIEIRFDRDDFEKMEAALIAMGYGVDVKWFRKRLNFEWNDVSVALDFTEGYGYIVELEEMCIEEEKEKVTEELKLRMKELGIEITPREIFDERFQYYKNNWRKILGVS
ncbi:MAG TPA: hypothetical protein VJJ76_00385 [archaeon]|nr:hypothetical protein [archaeon]